MTGGVDGMPTIGVEQRGRSDIDDWRCRKGPVSVVVGREKR